MYSDFNYHCMPMKLTKQKKDSKHALKIPHYKLAQLSLRKKSMKCNKSHKDVPTL